MHQNNFYSDAKRLPFALKTAYCHYEIFDNQATKHKIGGQVYELCVVHLHCQRAQLYFVLSHSNVRHAVAANIGHRRVSESFTMRHCLQLSGSWSQLRGAGDDSHGADKNVVLCEHLWGRARNSKTFDYRNG